MAKLTLTDIASLSNETSVVNTINANNAAIEAALEKTYTRDGTSPNTLEATMDANSNRIINLPFPVGDTEPLRKMDSDIGNLIGYVNEAENAATAAATSASNASTSASSASTSASNASTSASNAAASAASISGLSATISTLVTDVDAVEVDVADLQSNVTNLTNNFIYHGANTHAISVGPGALDGATYDVTGGVVSGLTGILTGVGSIGIGRDALGAPSNVSTLCVAIGERAMDGATNCYANIGIGFRTLGDLTSGSYTTAIGIDCFPLATTAASGTAVGAHAGTNKSGDFNASVVIGTGAAYCGGSVTNSVIIGPSAADGNATSDVYNSTNLIAIGQFCARKVTGLHNVFLGNTSGSLTTITGSQNLGIGRASAAALTSGVGNTMIGDGAGTSMSNCNFSTAIGFQSGANFTESLSLGYQAAASATRECRIGNANLLEIVSAASLIPAADNAVTVGKSGTRYSAIWAANGTIQTSDEREKIIQSEITSEQAKKFVSLVNPFFFKWAEGGKTIKGVPVKRTRLALDDNGKEIEEEYEATEEVVTSRAGNRIHASVSAQKVKSAMEAIGQDFGGWCLDDKDDPESRQSIRPDQLMWMLWKVTQDLIKENEEIKSRLEALEDHDKI